MTRTRTVTFEGKPLPARLPLGPITDECSAHGFRPVAFLTTAGHLALVIEGPGSVDALRGAVSEYLEGFAASQHQGEGNEVPPSLDPSPAHREIMTLPLLGRDAMIGGQGLAPSPSSTTANIQPSH